MKVLLDHVLI